MRKFKTFIVEDEEAPLKRLVTLLGDYPSIIDLKSLTIAKSFKEAHKILLNGNKFDLSILDKKLDGGKTCFDLITKQNKNNLGIITLNSQDQESQRHFEQISALGGYIVLKKPYNETDVADFIRELHSRETNINKENEKYMPILLKNKHDRIPVNQQDIIYIEVTDNLCRIFYREISLVKMSLASRQLSYFEEILDPTIFHKIGREYLINLNHVTSFDDGLLKLKGTYNDLPITLPLSEKSKTSLILRYPK